MPKLRKVFKTLRRDFQIWRSVLRQELFMLFQFFTCVLYVLIFMLFYIFYVNFLLLLPYFLHESTLKSIIEKEVCK